MSATLAPTSLSDAQLAAFREEGVLVARGLLTEGDLRPVRDELAAAVDRRARELHASGAISDVHGDAPFETRFGLLMAQSPAVQDGFDVVPLFGEAMFRFFRAPRLLDALERLI